MTDVEILRARYHLKVHFLKQSRSQPNGSWLNEQVIVFRDLPDDFAIDQVNSETGEYTPSFEAKNELNGEDIQGRHEFYEECYRMHTAFIVKRENWAQVLFDCVFEYKKNKGGKFTVFFF
jgi:hypothetical protein